MKKLLIVILAGFVLGISDILAQSDTIDTKENKSLDKEKTFKYMFGISINQGMSSKSKLVNDEASKYAYLSGGFRFNYFISEKFTLQSGIIFNDKGYTIKNAGISLLIDPPEYNDLRIKHFYIDIPVIIQYKFLKKSKIALFISGGFVGNIFIYESAGLMYDRRDNGVVILHESDYKPVSLSIQEALGIEYNLTQRLTLTIEQVFQHALMEFQNNRETFEYEYYDGISYNVTTYDVIEPRFTFIPYFIGVNISLTFKIN